MTRKFDEVHVVVMQKEKFIHVHKHVDAFTVTRYYATEFGRSKPTNFRPSGTLRCLRQ